jgi:hypothetical protein
MHQLNSFTFLQLSQQRYRRQEDARAIANGRPWVLIAIWDV